MSAAVLLDMDGTLTVPNLDFPEIRRQLGVPAGAPILESIAAWPVERRTTAERRLYELEAVAADSCELNPGCGELFDFLADRDLPTAIITRNTRASLEAVWAKHRLPECVTITREDAVHKPDPAPLHLACERLEADPALAYMIGDGVHDIEAGLAAGCRTVWLSHSIARDFDAEPWRTVPDLPALIDLLAQELEP
jgi:HAD superfamily hydrolase (TIGR01549 family)